MQPLKTSLLFGICLATATAQYRVKCDAPKDTVVLENVQNPVANITKLTTQNCLDSCYCGELTKEDGSSDKLWCKYKNEKGHFVHFEGACQKGVTGPLFKGAGQCYCQKK